MYTPFGWYMSSLLAATASMGELAVVNALRVSGGFSAHHQELKMMGRKTA